MNRRAIAAVSLLLSFVLVLVSVTTARPAHAQEIRVTPPITWVTPDGSPELRNRLTVARMHAEAAMPFQLDPPMKEVRLTSGQKTAIIITAIIVGALLIVGAVAIARPGKKLP